MSEGVANRQEAKMLRAVMVMGLFAALVFAATPLYAEIYQWRDEQGKVHYSDTKPAKIDAEDLTASVKGINTDSSSAEREKLERVFKAETAAEKSHHQRQQRAEENQQKQRSHQCEKARDQLQLLQGPLYFTRQDGSTYTISEQERQQRAQQFEAEIQQHCSR